MKQCNKCKKRKPFSEFSNHPKGKNGLRSHCKQCRVNYQRNYQSMNPTIRAKYKIKYQKTIRGCLHNRFLAMKQRCTDPKHPGYKRYGGRGIQVKFKNADEFINYVINELQIDPRDLQIDRINNDENYEPGNIRFITAKENCNNK